MAQATSNIKGKTTTDPDILTFMELARKALNQDLPAPKDVYNFAKDEHTRLAIEGKKTATTTWPIPDPIFWDVGDLSVGLSEAGDPVMIIRTLSLVKCRFGDVEESFALAEAEGDYKEYYDGHVEWFRRTDPNGYLFNDDSIVLCERFECVYPRKDIDPPTL